MGETKTYLLGMGNNKRSIKEKIKLVAQTMREADCYLSKVIVDKEIGLFRITIQEELTSDLTIERRNLEKHEYADQDIYDLNFEL